MFCVAGVTVTNWRDVGEGAAAVPVPVTAPEVPLVGAIPFVVGRGVSVVAVVRRGVDDVRGTVVSFVPPLPTGVGVGVALGGAMTTGSTTRTLGIVGSVCRSRSCASTAPTPSGGSAGPSSQRPYSGVASDATFLKGRFDGVTSSRATWATQHIASSSSTRAANARSRNESGRCGGRLLGNGK